MNGSIGNDPPIWSDCTEGNCMSRSIIDSLYGTSEEILNPEVASGRVVPRRNREDGLSDARDHKDDIRAEEHADCFAYV